MQTEEHPSPSVVLDHLQKAHVDGYHILSVIEYRFSGPIPDMMEGDSLVEHPDSLTTFTCIIPHGDHWHLYLFTLAKPGFDTTTEKLHSETLKTFQSLSMDERATVSDVGRA